VIYVVLAQGFPPACRAGALGLAMMLGRAGGIASSFFGGLLLSIPGLPDTPFLAALAVAVVLALTGCLVIDRHVRPAA
jgi:MFS family permease